MKIIFIFTILFSSLSYAEEFTLICDGNREFRSFKGKKIHVKDFESVRLKIKKNSMEYIGVNSGRNFIFSNKEYIAPKRPPHEDILIKELYKLTSKKIKASQTITDNGDSEESSISLISLNINRLTGKLNEIESVSNKKTLQKSVSNNFQAECKMEDRSY